MTWRVSLTSSSTPMTPSTCYSMGWDSTTTSPQTTAKPSRWARLLSSLHLQHRHQLHWRHRHFRSAQCAHTFSALSFSALSLGAEPAALLLHMPSWIPHHPDPKGSNRYGQAALVAPALPGRGRMPEHGGWVVHFRGQASHAADLHQLHHSINETHSASTVPRTPVHPAKTHKEEPQQNFRPQTPTKHLVQSQLLCRLCPRPATRWDSWPSCACTPTRPSGSCPASSATTAWSTGRTCAPIPTARTTSSCPR